MDHYFQFLLTLVTYFMQFAKQGKKYKNRVVQKKRSRQR